MKKIINNKMYNTETATMVASYNNGCSMSDFCHFSEELYLKKTGEFFLCGSGGAMSKYARPFDNGWSGSSQIIPMTENAAKEWVMDRCDTDTYINLFGEVEE